MGGKGSVHGWRAACWPQPDCCDTGHRRQAARPLILLKRRFPEARASTLVERGSAMTATVSTPKRESPRLGSVGLRFRSILVATDCLPASDAAVTLAARLAKECHARLYVLHSILPELYGVDMRGAVPEFAATDLKNGRENLHRYVEHIPELRTVKHKEIAFLGSAIEAIQSAGESNGIDLLVLGSHGRHGLAKLTLGSVAEWAIRRLAYPVLVAGPMCDKSLRPIQSIVLATDLAEQTWHSVQYASCLAQDHGARLTLMHVLPQAATTE